MKNFLLNYLFATSKRPVLFRDLLEANALFNEGMLVDGAKLNFKFRYFRLYAIYAALSFVVLFVGLAVLHQFLEKIDAHVSIVATMLITAGVFAGFDLFKWQVRKAKTATLIKEAWQIHFPYFPYEKFSTRLEEVYGVALKEEIPRGELEKFILEKLVEGGKK